MSSSGDHASSQLPAVDERLVAPDTGYEIDDGKLRRVPPALEPHGDRHSKVAALLEAHVGAEFNVAIDMLTRASETTDIAPDVSVYPRARDARTGGRQIEQLAFDIVSAESLAHAAGRASKLIARGVRRVFAIDVQRVRAFEWSRELETWSILDLGAVIEDPALAVSVPVEALVRAADTDDAVARALLAKQNPILEAALLTARSTSVADAILVVLAARGLSPRADQRARILAETDPAILVRWLANAATCATADELLE